MNAANLSLLNEEHLLLDGYRDSWSTLLSYFQERAHVRYFPLSSGTVTQVEKAGYILRNEFAFNHESHQLGEAFDWQKNPSTDLEWLILLHKFYYLKDLAGAYDFTGDERYAEKWMNLIDSWINQVPEGFIGSQVTGRRLQQWVLSFHTFVSKGRSPTITPVFLERLMHAINAQTQYLCTHLTPAGNHRTLELYAIFLVAVTFPELRLSHYFLSFSKQKLLENMCLDLLSDGVHRELSTDYHHIVLKNYLRFRELAMLNHIGLPAACDVLLNKALEFAYTVHKPDSFIPAINDGDCNSYLPLLKKAHRCYPNPHLHYVITQGTAGLPPPQRSRGFSDSGYYVLRSDWSVKPYQDALYLFFDCGSLGFGSHGHYDALNIEIAAFGHSLIVDPGRYTYSENSADDVNWRHYFKGTAAHNTVVVDGLDQIPYRCEKPVDPEPEAMLKKFITQASFDFLHGQVISHQYPVVHERMIFFALPEYWIVTDLLRAEELHRYDLYFHLSSRAQDLTSLESNAFCHIIDVPNLRLVQPYDANIEVAIEQGYVSPEYGVKYPAPVIKFSMPQAGNTILHTLLYPFKDQPPDLHVKQLPVYQAGRLCAGEEASAIQISLRTAEGRCFEDYYFMQHSDSESEYAFADFSCAGRVMYLRRNAVGGVIVQHIEI